MLTLKRCCGHVVVVVVCSVAPVLVSLIVAGVWFTLLSLGALHA